MREVLVKMGSCHRSDASLSGLPYQVAWGCSNSVFPGDKVPVWLPQCPSPSRKFLKKFSFLWGNGFHGLMVSLEYLHSARPTTRELRADEKGSLSGEKDYRVGKMSTNPCKVGQGCRSGTECLSDLQSPGFKFHHVRGRESQIINSFRYIIK